MGVRVVFVFYTVKQTHTLSLCLLRSMAVLTVLLSLWPLESFKTNYLLNCLVTLTLSLTHTFPQVVSGDHEYINPPFMTPTHTDLSAA